MLFNKGKVKYQYIPVYLLYPQVWILRCMGYLSVFKLYGKKRTERFFV